MNADFYFDLKIVIVIAVRYYINHDPALQIKSYDEGTLRAPVKCGCQPNTQKIIYGGMRRQGH